jgi:hypothetical protein
VKTYLIPALLAAAAATASAEIIDITLPNTRLSAVIGNQFMVGNQLFTVGAGGFQSAQFNAADIFISPVINGDPLTGQGFRLFGAWNGIPNAAASRFILTYDVDLTPEAIAQGNRFNLATLRFNGTATGAGSFARVDESVGTNEGAFDTLTVSAFGEGSSTLQDAGAVANLTHMRLITDAQFLAVGASGTAGASFIDNSFGQFIIPAPGAAVLLGMGLVMARRRR